MLKVVVDSLDDVDEAFRGEYEERDGKFQLQLTGAFSEIDRNKLTESLNKERGLLKTAKGQIVAFGEWTPEKVTALEGERDQLHIEVTALKKDGGPTGEDLEKILESRILARVAPLERDNKRQADTIATITGERDQLAQARAGDKIQSAVLGAFGAKDLGGNTDARPDVELWAASAFEVDDGGNVVSRDGIGITPGLKPAEVFKDMKDQGHRRHWFGPTHGAGATGSKTGVDSGDNPFILDERTKKPTSFTKAAAMCQSDPARAKRFCVAAKAQEFFPSLFK